MTRRLNKLERMSDDDKLVESNRFWTAPDDALFPPETVALVCSVSIAWLQVKRCTGDGIPFVKGLRKIHYQKKDVLDYFNTKKLLNTSMQSG